MTVLAAPDTPAGSALLFQSTAHRGPQGIPRSADDIVRRDIPEHPRYPDIIRNHSLDIGDQVDHDVVRIRSIPAFPVPPFHFRALDHHGRIYLQTVRPETRIIEKLP